MKKNLSVLALLFFSLAVLAVYAGDSFIDGNWEIVISSDHGDFGKVMKFEQDGESLKVSYDDQVGEGTIKEDKVEWSIKLITPMGDLDTVFRGKINDKEMSGEVEMMGSSMDWNGKKVE